MAGKTQVPLAAAVGLRNGREMQLGIFRNIWEMCLCLVPWNSLLGEVLHTWLLLVVGGFPVPGGNSFQLIINCRGKSPSECAEQISSVLWRNMDAATWSSWGFWHEPGWHGPASRLQCARQDGHHLKWVLIPSGPSLLALCQQETELSAVAQSLGASSWLESCATAAQLVPLLAALLMGEHSPNTI